MLYHEAMFLKLVVTLLMFAFLFAHSVAKQIAPSGDANEDLNLNNPNLYIMYGVGPNGGGAGALPIHNTGAGNPTLSIRTFNPVIDATENNGAIVNIVNTFSVSVCSILCFSLMIAY